MLVPRRRIAAERHDQRHLEEVGAACKGGGKTLEDPADEESEVAECEVCGVEGEVSATIKKQVTCEKCGGTGKA